DNCVNASRLWSAISDPHNKDGERIGFAQPGYHRANGEGKHPPFDRVVGRAAAITFVPCPLMFCPATLEPATTRSIPIRRVSQPRSSGSVPPSRTSLRSTQKA